MTNPILSVVIPFHNSEMTFSRCLEGVFAQSLQLYEVILVNNNSIDRSALIAKQFAAEYPDKCIYLVEPKQGPSFARNRGVKNARGEIIAFTDSDCIPDQHWLRDILKAFDKPFTGAVAGNIKGTGSANSVEIFHALFTLRGESHQRICKSFFLNKGGFATANLAVRRNLFESLGGFDESRSFGEDHDLCARIYESGHSIKYIPSGVVYHIHRGDVISTCRQAFHFGESHPFLLSKHFRRYLLIEFGGQSLRTSRVPFKAWINLGSAEKKLLAIVVLGLLYSPFLLLIPAYFAFLFYTAGAMAKRQSINLDVKDRLVVPFLLITKSGAMTTGRLWGSAKYRAFCL
jgi:cellulose synthase/poly-beta-1,6-N-acetylglucosamine synthase-like glycosyltransferase